MRIIRGAVLALTLGDAAVGQVAEVLPLGDVITALDARSPVIEGETKTLERLVRLLKAQLQIEARKQDGNPAGQPAGRAARQRRLVIQAHDDGKFLLISGDRAHLDTVESIVAQLRREPMRELLVQCTLVTLPMDVAEMHGLAAEQTTPIDEAAAGKVLRAAVEAKGQLQNMPEFRVAPLVPFRHTTGIDLIRPPAAAQPLNLRGEAVLGDDEALFAVQLVAGKLPEDPTALPPTPVLNRSFRVPTGTGVMLMTRGRQGAAPGDDAVVLWLRCTIADPDRREQPVDPPPDPGTNKEQ